LEKNNPEIPLNVILTWATKGGARGLGFDNVIGSFEEGRRPGAVLIENVDLETLKTTPKTTSRRLI
ncbi:MAG: hypothetical protein RR858_03555, partial [Mucinivorans sp.]